MPLTDRQKIITIIILSMILSGLIVFPFCLGFTHYLLVEDRLRPLLKAYDLQLTHSEFEFGFLSSHSQIVLSLPHEAENHNKVTLTFSYQHLKSMILIKPQFSPKLLKQWGVELESQPIIRMDLKSLTELGLGYLSEDLLVFDQVAIRADKGKLLPQDGEPLSIDGFKIKVTHKDLGMRSGYLVAIEAKELSTQDQFLGPFKSLIFLKNLHERSINDLLFASESVNTTLFDNQQPAESQLLSYSPEMILQSLYLRTPQGAVTGRGKLKIPASTGQLEQISMETIKGEIEISMPQPFAEAYFGSIIEFLRQIQLVTFHGTTESWITALVKNRIIQNRGNGFIRLHLKFPQHSPVLSP